MRRRALTVLLLVGAACSNSSEVTSSLATGTTAPLTSAVATTATTSALPIAAPPATIATSTTGSTSQDPSTTIPIPDTDGETDHGAIWRELIEYHNWAFENPDSADATIYLSAGCDCLERATAILAEYVENGWRALGGGLVVHDIDVNVSSSSFALMTVVDEQTELTIVATDGETVDVLQRRPKTFFDVRIRLTEDGWRIAEWNQRGVEGAAE